IHPCPSPSIRRLPSSMATSTASVRGPGDSASLPIASAFCEKSPVASAARASRSIAEAGTAASKAASAKSSWRRRRMASDVLATFVAGNERRPGLGPDRTLRPVDDRELPVGLDLADHHRLVQVVIALVHGQREARRRL